MRGVCGLGRVAYEASECLCRAVRLIVESCPHLFSHIDLDRVYCVSSRGASTLAVARVYGLGGPWRAVGFKPSYLIEAVSEGFSRLTPRGRVEVLAHELLHIPSTFSGALRPHGRLVNEKRVREIIKCLESKGALRGVEKALKRCP